MMQSRRLNGLEFLAFDKLQANNGIRHFVTTRRGGRSASPYDELNLSFSVGDEAASVAANRSRVAEALGIAVDAFTFGQQKHTNNVAIVSSATRGRGWDQYETAIANTDALVTNTPGICLMVLLADCSPIMFFDAIKRVVGLAHAGRAGAAQGIVKKTVEVMQNRFQSSPAEILVAIGPSICGERYPITEENAAALRKSLRPDTRSLWFDDGKIKFDPVTAHREQLLSVGISEENIELAEMCTFDLPELFFSERRDRAPTGRFAAGMMLV